MMSSARVLFNRLDVSVHETERWHCPLRSGSSITTRDVSNMTVRMASGTDTIG